MKKNIIFLSFFSFIFICGIFYPIVNLLSKDKAKNLQNLTLEKAQTALITTIPYLNKAIQNSDDISLLSNTELLANVPNVASCFILDKNSKVIIHNNINEWNTEKHTNIYNEAVIRRKELIQEMPDDNFFLLSEPVSNDYSLMCIVSVQKSKEIAKYWQIKYYSIASAIAMLIIIIFYFFSKLLILFPFNRIKKILENKSGNAINEKYNEITDIFTTERDKISKKIEKLEEDNESLIKIIEHYHAASIKDNLAFILLSSSNDVVYSHDSTGKIIKTNLTKNKQHILEAVKDPNIVKVIIKANETPGNKVIGSSGSYKISAVSINKDNKVVGTIVKITEN
jgi:DNA-binding transcriptional MerR regulator